MIGTIEELADQAKAKGWGDVYVDITERDTALICSNNEVGAHMCIYFVDKNNPIGVYMGWEDFEESVHAQFVNEMPTPQECREYACGERKMFVAVELSLNEIRSLTGIAEREGGNVSDVIGTFVEMSLKQQDT